MCRTTIFKGVEVIIIKLIQKCNKLKHKNSTLGTAVKNE